MGYSKDRLYSVKTAYMLGKSGNLDDFHRAWSLDVSPKVRHFLWHACMKSLPVREVLQRRHLVENASCPWCVGSEDTFQHALFFCPHFARY